MLFRYCQISSSDNSELFISFSGEAHVDVSHAVQIFSSIIQINYCSSGRKLMTVLLMHSSGEIGGTSQSPSLLAEVWPSYKPHSAINGFRKAGVHPFNKDVVHDSSTIYSTPFQFRNPPNFPNVADHPSINPSDANCPPVLDDHPPVDPTQPPDNQDPLTDPTPDANHPTIDEQDTIYLYDDSSPGPSQTDYDTTYPSHIDHGNTLRDDQHEDSFNHLSDDNLVSITDLLGDNMIEVNGKSTTTTPIVTPNQQQLCNDNQSANPQSDGAVSGNPPVNSPNTPGSSSRNKPSLSTTDTKTSKQTKKA